ncbi:CHAT domain-containing protein [Sphingobacterium phlebotomi]|uniref:CHAT domain-containing protein n=1 Tax=Sphingobacterium phlebotomi TaxID=2605433 RepID=A0A5D4GYK8_9SPHI|nr:CHAT domain-containing protein [Sphingobacterium phlebotomi]TYR32969.1 CHAT domain-containing protein [Sphingobacterium phlebotomi]
MAIVRTFLLGFIFSCFACKNQTEVHVLDNTSLDSIATSLIDSLGELAYDHYASFEKQPDILLKPIENKVLNEAQKETYIWILINMAYSFQEHSRFLASIKYYEKALLYDNENNVLNLADRLTYIYKPLANNYTVIADYEKAEKLQLKSIHEAQNNETKASFYHNLALLYVYKGENEKSKDAALSGLTYSTENGYLKVLLHYSLSSAYVTLNDIDSAKWHNNFALQVANTLPMDENLALSKIPVLERRSLFLLQEDQTDLSRKYLLEALSVEETFFPHTRFREKANLYNSLGENFLIKDEFTQAKVCFEEAKKLFNDHVVSSDISSYTKISVLKNLGLICAKQHIDSAFYYFEQAIEEDFAFQQNITSKSSHITGNKWNQHLLSLVFNHIGNPEDFDQEKLAKLLWLTELAKGRMLWNDINRATFWESDTAELSQGMRQLQQLYLIRDNLMDSTDIKEINQSIQSMLTDFQLEEQYFTRKVALPNFDNFQKQLTGSLSITYSYFIHSDSSLSIFKVDNGKISYRHQKNIGLLDSIAQFKTDYFSTSPHLFNNNPKRYFTRAQHLKNQLLPFLPSRPITLRLSLHDELYVLPFDALSESNRFLIEDFDIQYVNSLLIKDLYPNTSFYNPQINILYRDKYSAPLADLHFVKKEVDNLQSHYKTTTFSYEDLPLRKLEHAFKTSSIIHIAAHTVVTPKQEARLLLHQSISADQLRYYHIKSPLVVLSACNTASGNLLPSEGLESINRAFLSKGIPGVMATHWFASDDAMLGIMAKFYNELTTCKSPIRALAEAKRQYLSEQSALGSNPWYWSNIAYTGTDIKIDLQKYASLRQSAWKILVLSLVLASCLYGILRFTKFKNKQYKTYHKHQK